MAQIEIPLLKDNSVDPEGEFALNVPDHLFYLLFQTAHHRDARFGDRLAEVGLTLPRWRALAVIRRIGSCSMKQLARYSATDRTTLTRSVDQLVAAGLVDRHVPPQDRRVVLLNLTERGEASHAKAVKLLLDYNRESATGLSQDDQRQVARALEVILKNLIPDSEELEAILKFGRSGKKARGAG